MKRHQYNWARDCYFEAPENGQWSFGFKSKEVLSLEHAYEMLINCLVIQLQTAFPELGHDQIYMYKLSFTVCNENNKYYEHFKIKYREYLRTAFTMF